MKKKKDKKNLFYFDHLQQFFFSMLLVCLNVLILVAVPYHVLLFNDFDLFPDQILCTMLYTFLF